ncbi:MAG: D-aminoacyl-tRNA deacylase [Breznakibacter sp.]
MRVVIQRVRRASVEIDGQLKGEIGKGLLIFFGVACGEGMDDLDWLVNKVVNLRIFSDADGVMNLSVQDIDGDILVVSQFTLHAKTKKGNRPSYISAAQPAEAIPVYEEFIRNLELRLGKKVQSGIFGADMQVELVNDGPVTIVIDTKNKE